MSILYFILILLLLVLVHEFGHFQMAKWVKMQVDEFAFGFPPKLFSFMHKNTKFSFNALPIGGYVKIKGEDGEDVGKNSFGSKPKWAQAAVLLAGIFMNLVTAYVLFFGALSLGIPRTAGSENINAQVMVVDVVKGSPAEVAGLAPGDIVEKITYAKHTLKIESPDTITSAVSTGVSVTLDIIRKTDGVNKNLQINVKPEKVDGINRIGVSMQKAEVGRLPFFKALVVAGKETYIYTIETAKGFGQLFYKIFTGVKVGDQVAGPVGLVKQVGQVSQFGLAHILFFAGILSINLAILNLIPFPGLDGGRVLFVIIESITRKKVPQKVFGIVNAIGIGLLLLLILAITIKDIIRF